VTSRSASAQHLRDLTVLRRVRDRIDREYAQPLDVEALARGAHMSAGHLSRQFRLAFGESPYSYLMTRRIERAMALLRRRDLSVTIHGTFLPHERPTAKSPSGAIGLSISGLPVRP
jgi:AraC-like DNA-binding protein